MVTNITSPPPHHCLTYTGFLPTIVPYTVHTTASIHTVQYNMGWWEIRGKSQMLIMSKTRWSIAQAV